MARTKYNQHPNLAIDAGNAQFLAKAIMGRHQGAETHALAMHLINHLHVWLYNNVHHVYGNEHGDSLKQLLLNRDWTPIVEHLVGTVDSWLEPFYVQIARAMVNGWRADRQIVV